jgi:undecaprenyl-diphosphatase
LVASLLWFAFIHLGSEVAEGDTLGFDTQVLLVARSLREAHPWLVEACRDLSGLGSTAVLLLFAVLAVGYLAIVSAWTTAAIVSASILAGTLLVGLLKSAFGRLRPDPSFAGMIVPGLSFPSGHASMSAIVFLTLGALLASRCERWTERIFILSAAALIAVLVGVSRVALGVHWATDVIGGWAFGAGWALLGLLLDRRLTRHPT